MSRPFRPAASLATPAAVGAPRAMGRHRFVPANGAAPLGSEPALDTLAQALHAAQVELATARERYRELYASAPVAYLTLDAEGVVQQANACAAQLLGIDREALPGSVFDGRVTAEQVGVWRRHARLRLQGQGPARTELTLLRGDGRPFPAQIDTQALTDEGDAGAAPQLRLMLTDLSARQRAEVDARLAAAVFEVHDAVMITDAAGRIERVNGAFTRLTGYRADEVIGHTPRLLHSGRHDQSFYAAMWAIVLGTGHWEGEVCNRHKDGQDCSLWLTIRAVRDAAGQTTHHVGTWVDLRPGRARDAEVLSLALRDPLTGLPNRRMLKERLQQAIDEGARAQRESALLFIDLDHFKDINDALGHEVGDRVLECVAQRLSACVREGDTVARLGGDEFVLLLTADLSPQHALAMAQARAVGEKVLAALAAPCEIDGRALPLGASIGVVLFHDAHDTVAELLRRADVAMYQAKAAGRRTLCFFDPGVGDAMRARTELEAELVQAVPHDELRLLYQPVVDADGRVLGAEALVRWQHPTRGLLGPCDFIPIAEARGLIHALGHWVLERACIQLADWATRHDAPGLAALTLEVNVSAHELRHPQFVDSVLAVLARTGADPQRLKLELTETVLLDNLDETVVKMDRLRALGVHFVLDDFGTGYASLTYLRRLPLDQLKIDRSFVQGVLEGGHDATIARSLLDLGRNLGVPVVAEGVETAAQHAMLRAWGCTSFQGYLFGRPGMARQLEDSARAGVVVRPGS